MIIFAVRKNNDTQRAMLGMCYILDPDLSLPNKVVMIIFILNKVVIIVKPDTRRWLNA